MPNPGNPSVVVDDRSPLIKYAGQWQQDGANLEFAGTTSDSHTLGATATFAFEGTSIVVYGTINADPASSMNFAINKDITGTFKAPTTLPVGTDALHHQPLYTSPNLPAGPHTLVITQATTSPGAHIFLDYIIYTPSSNSASTGLTYIVDDNDPRIQYDNWVASQNDRDVQHTFHSSSAAGAKITFAFEGTGVSIVGDLPRRLAVGNMATITIDNGPATNFAPPLQIAEIIPGQQIFTSPKLTQNNHTLTLTTVGNDPLLIDYFLVTPGEITRPTPSPSPTSSLPTSAPTTSKKPNSTKESQTPSASTSSLPATASKTNVGAIAGGSIAAIIVLALGFAFFMFWRKRKADSRMDSDRISLTSERYAVQPFTPMAPAPGSYHNYPPSQPSNYAPSVYPAPSTYGGSNHAGYGAGQNYGGYGVDPAATAAYPYPGYGHQHTRSTGSQPTANMADHRSGYTAPSSPPLRDVKRRPSMAQPNASAYDGYEEGPAMLAYASSPPPSPGLPNPHPDDSRPPPGYSRD